MIFSVGQISPVHVVLAILALFSVLFTLGRVFVRTEKDVTKTKSFEDVVHLWAKKAQDLKEGVAAISPEGQYIFVNKSYAQSFGYDLADYMLGKNWKTFVRNFAGHDYIDSITIALKENGEWVGDFPVMAAHQDVTPHISMSLLEDGCIFCIARDTSIMAKQKKEADIVKIAVDAADDGIAITDSNNKIIFLNDSFLRLHALDVSRKEEYLGMDWRHVYSQKGQDHINSVVLPSAIVRGQWKGYLDVARKDGSIFYGDASLTKLSNGLVLGVMRDVTERKIIEKEKEKLKEQAYMAQKMETITRLINGMGGDFKGTLSLIKERAQQAIARDDIPEERRQHMGEIVSASEKAEEMLTRIMSFSTGKNEKAKEINAVDVALSVGNQLTKVYMGRVRSSTDVRVDEALIFAEKDQFEKVILGLCENAVEAIEHDGGVVTLYMDIADAMPIFVQEYLYKKENAQHGIVAPTIKNSSKKKYLLSGFLSRDKKYIRLSVIDNGTGIPPEIFANILDPFFTTKKRSVPAGIGLSYVHGFVLSAGGAFAVETEMGVGTSTHMFFPIHAK